MLLAVLNILFGSGSETQLAVLRHFLPNVNISRQKTDFFNGSVQVPIEMLTLFSYRRRDSREDRYRDYDRERRGARRMGRSRYTPCSCILCLLPLKFKWVPVRGHNGSSDARLELLHWVGHLWLVRYHFHYVKNLCLLPLKLMLGTRSQTVFPMPGLVASLG